MVTRSRKSESTEFWSRNKVCIALAFAALSWAVAASSYAAANEPAGKLDYRDMSNAVPIRGIAPFGFLGWRLAIVGIEEAPNAHHVIAHAISERPWLVALFLGLQTIPLGAWFLLGRVEKELEKPRQRRYR
jgi:hypothetical protein